MPLIAIILHPMFAVVFALQQTSEDFGA